MLLQKWESKSNWENIPLGVTPFTHLDPSAIQAMQPVLPKCCGHLLTTQVVVECQNLEEAEILERIPKEVIKQLLLARFASSAVVLLPQNWVGVLLLVSQSTGLAHLIQNLSCSLSSVCTCFLSTDLICKQKWPLKPTEATMVNFNINKVL